MLNAKLERIHKIIAYGYIAFVGIGVLLAVLGLIRGGGDELGFGLACIFVAGPVGLFHLYAAKGAGRGEQWGRNMSRGIAILFLFGFPIGTILGAYMLGKTEAKWETGQPKQPVEA
jgi:hypothetical protein